MRDTMTKKKLISSLFLEVSTILWWLHCVLSINQALWVLNGKYTKPASNFMKKVGFSTKISQCSFRFGLKDKEEKSSTSFNLEKVVT